MTPFRSEKNSNWEGAYRVPAMVRWPGHIKAGIGCQRHCVAPGLAAHAPRGRGCSRRERAAPQGHESRRHDLQSASRRLQPAAATSPARTQESPRKEFFYFNDDGDLVALRYDNWKLVFAEQRATGTMGIWSEPFLLPCASRRSSTCASTPRTRGHHLEHLLRLAARPCVCIRPGAGNRWPAPHHLPGVPAEPEIGPASALTRSWTSCGKARWATIKSAAGCK